MSTPESSSTDAPQTESEGSDNSDKPPQAMKLADRLNKLSLHETNGSFGPSPTVTPGLSNGKTLTQNDSPNTFPLPPPDSLITGDKQPGLTRAALEKLSLDNALNIEPGAIPTTSSIPSPTIASPTDSYWDGTSAPPSRAASRPGSRAPSMSSGVSGNKLASQIAAALPGRQRRGSQPELPKSKPASVHSDKGDSHKFTLKELLSSGPKLNRKSSQRSTSSKRSDSDAGDGRARSTAGDSTVSLSQKYGVCQKVAIGKGATSVVRLAHKWDRSEEKLYAIKEFRKRRKNESEKEYIKKLTAEFCISSTLHHPNVVETVDLIQDEAMHWCEVMEFCPGGDLYAAIKRGGMSPSEVECSFKQLLTGVKYLHSQGVAHRDLKPENLFFDGKGHLKIGDYGASTVYRLPWETTVHMSSGLCGSEPYIAPEQFLNKPYDARLVDIWACGIVYYCLHFQELPWRAAQAGGDQLYAAYAQACASSKPETSAMPQTIHNLSPRPCRPLIRQMLEPDPRKRFSIEAVIEHPWVQQIEICHDVKDPKHIHGCAREMGMAYADKAS
ncbi:other/HAL protein kinase [Coprinopsis marcescibilis]|uniref:non-specific serine/threonine protein kinase n=1 Tax=Coprinopsis marcescibilis TaxID=230819 RepID=A0A5C3L6J6_COPMA|nr:other/HAL protein kinase [Coprinopsis marcescibilis]